MKTSEVMSITGLSAKELPILLKEIGVKASWQSLSKQNKAFMDGEPVDDLLNEDQAIALIKALESPESDIQKRASRLFKAVAPLFRGSKKEVAQSFSELPTATVSTGGDWISDLMSSSGGPVKYDRSGFEGDNAGVVELNV